MISNSQNYQKNSFHAAFILLQFERWVASVEIEIEASCSKKTEVGPCKSFRCNNYGTLSYIVCILYDMVPYYYINMVHPRVLSTKS